MPLTASFSHFRTLLAVPFLAVMLAFPAYAEPTPDAAPAQQAEPSAPNAETGTDGAPPPHAVTQDSQDAVEEPDAATDDTDGTPEGAPDNGDAATAPAAPEQPKSTVLIDIDKSTQEMTVFVDGVQQYSWPVSTGMRGYSTPSGTYTATSMNEIWYSKQWDNAPMPHADLLHQEGPCHTRHLG